MSAQDITRDVTAALTRAITAGATSAFARLMAGEKGLAPESIRDGVMAAFGNLDPKVAGRSVLTPRARTSLGDALSVLAYNVGAAMANREPV